MDELIDILTPTGEPTGKSAMKSEAHKNGWFHGTVHVWVFTSSRKIVLQKRAMTKKVLPGLWDISAAGHIGAGESVIDAAKREVLEELGLDLKDQELMKIGTRVHQISHPNGIQDNEIHHVFLAELKKDFETLHAQKAEIDAIQLFDLEVLRTTKDLENILLPRFHDYYNSIYNRIVQYLSH
ncbi:MAG: hydrolase [Flavobacteriaceae bacterium]|nr:hydrolase [Flavobacteriaceae bacterium]|tara:strand:- start:58303 stop:58848 length:546 start_codon:yes stop_codon:yes gene_type:complete